MLLHNRFRPIDWITDDLAVASCEGPFPSDAVIIDVRYVKDHSFIPLRTFGRVMAEIRSAKYVRCKVVIHCLGGLSRSPTFAAVWLSLDRKICLDNAFEMVKEKRPVIIPHPEQIRSAREFLQSIASVE